MEFLRQVLVIAHKDVRAELRTKEAVNASFAFALVVLLLFSFAFDPESETMKEIAGGLLWIVYAFAAALVLNRSFARELPNDCLDGLVICADLGRRVVPRQSAGELRISAGGGTDLVAGLRHLLFVESDAVPAEFAADSGVGRVGADGNRHHVQRADSEHPAARSDAANDDVSDSLARVNGRDAIDGSADSRASAGQRHLIWLKLLVGFDAVYTAAALVLVDFVLVGIRPPACPCWGIGKLCPITDAISRIGNRKAPRYS